MLLDNILQYQMSYILWYDIIYNIMTSALLCSKATTSSPCCSSGLASLPSLCCPGPALADTLMPDPLRLCYGHCPGTAPAVEPHPDVHLVEPAAVAPVQLSVGRGASKIPIVLTVSADVTLNEGGDRTDVEAGQAKVTG